MPQDRKRHIENLKQEIGLKFGRTIESAADFNLLSIAIQQATSETISPSTLKRIFGYVRSDAAPSATTLSILSRYVGYAGWSDFCRNYIPSETGCGLIHKSIRTRLLKQKRLILSLTIACIVLAVPCILLTIRIDNVMTAYRDAVSDSTVTVISDTVFLAAPGPVRTQSEMDEEKYQEIRSHCIMKVRHMTDSVMAMRSTLPLYRYVEKCDSAYFHSLKFRLFYYRKISPIALACILLLTAYRNQKMFRPRRKAECSTRNIRRRNSHTIYLAEI